MKPAENTNCGIAGSEMCNWLAREDCYGCYLNSFKPEEREKALASWKVTQSLIPDNSDELSGEVCQFCRGEEKGERSCFAILDLAHAEPASERGMFFGFGKKVRNPIGSLLQVSISCCKRCHKNFVVYDAIKWVTMILAVAAGILLGALIPEKAIFGGALQGFGPFALLVIAVAVGAVLSLVLSEAYLKKIAKETYVSALDIPAVGRFVEAGWFLPTSAQEKPGMTRLIFSGKKAGASSRLKYEGSGEPKE